MHCQPSYIASVLCVESRQGVHCWWSLDQPSSPVFVPSTTTEDLWNSKKRQLDSRVDHAANRISLPFMLMFRCSGCYTCSGTQGVAHTHILVSLKYFSVMVNGLSINFDNCYDFIKLRLSTNTQTITYTFL